MPWKDDDDDDDKKDVPAEDARNLEAGQYDLGKDIGGHIGEHEEDPSI